MEHKIVIRYTAPSKMDNAPYGTIYSVTDEINDTKMYIQLSQEESHPQWQDLGVLFEVVFGPLLNDQPFMSKCLDLYKSQTHTASDILKLFKDSLKKNK